jgi:hypothetical protein
MTFSHQSVHVDSRVDEGIEASLLAIAAPLKGIVLRGGR